MLIVKYIYLVTPLFGLKTEAEGHAQRSSGVAAVGDACADDITEESGVAATRRALPPGARIASSVLHLAVTCGVVGILATLAALGVGDAAEDFDFRQQEQLVRRGVDGAALVARRGLLAHFLDSGLHFAGHQRKNGRQVRASHCAVCPAARVGVGAVHILSVSIAVVQLEGQRCLPARSVGVVVLADDVDLVVRAADGHHFAVAYRPAVRHAPTLAGCDDGVP